MKPKIIKSWEDLAQLPDSATHRLQIKDWCGWVISKEVPPKGRKHQYLSSHSFYKSHYKQTTQKLRDCGFDITLVGSED